MWPSMLVCPLRALTCLSTIPKIFDLEEGEEASLRSALGRESLFGVVVAYFMWTPTRQCRHTANNGCTEPFSPITEYSMLRFEVSPPKPRNNLKCHRRAAFPTLSMGSFLPLCSRSGCICEVAQKLAKSITLESCLP